MSFRAKVIKGSFASHFVHSSELYGELLGLGKTLIIEFGITMEVYLDGIIKNIRSVINSAIVEIFMNNVITLFKKFYGFKADEGLVHSQNIREIPINY